MAKLASHDNVYRKEDALSTVLRLVVVQSKELYAQPTWKEQVPYDTLTVYTRTAWLAETQNWAAREKPYTPCIL
jgi:hypothetical protein